MKVSSFPPGETSTACPCEPTAGHGGMGGKDAALRERGAGRRVHLPRLSDRDSEIQGRGGQLHGRVRVIVLKVTDIYARGSHPRGAACRSESASDMRCGVRKGVTQTPGKRGTHPWGPGDRCRARDPCGHTCVASARNGQNLPPSSAHPARACTNASTRDKGAAAYCACPRSCIVRGSATCTFPLVCVFKISASNSLLWGRAPAGRKGGEGAGLTCGAQRAPSLGHQIRTCLFAGGVLLRGEGGASLIGKRGIPAKSGHSVNFAKSFSAIDSHRIRRGVGKGGHMTVRSST